VFEFGVFSMLSLTMHDDFCRFDVTESIWSGIIIYALTAIYGQSFWEEEVCNTVIVCIGGWSQWDASNVVSNNNDLLVKTVLYTFLTAVVDNVHAVQVDGNGN
jgi:hypothetical protein